jgi:sugar phosphate isomerase/epimerase
MVNSIASKPVLLKSYKNRYPFKLGCPSFIYQDDYVPNVEKLAPFLDEIELLFLESAFFQNNDAKSTVAELASLAKQFEITYNIHLPTDISISDPDHRIQHKAVHALQKTIDITSSLFPSTFTLHIPYLQEKKDKEHVKRWQEDVFNGLKQLLSSGIDSKSISVETLDYPFEWIDKIIDDFNISVCIDTGHLMMHGFDCNRVYGKHEKRTPIIHLHGIKKTKDHLPIDRLSHKQMDSLLLILKQFTGVVSLEVFSYRYLQDSLIFLEKITAGCD